ncbi:MAG: YqgE/AlgH family protein [Chthoniobacterales bacterium]
MTDFSQNDGSDLTGSLLVATPAMTDPNFRRSILFLSHHSDSSGALGFVINRPVLGQLADLALSGDETIDHAPVYYGGPVDQDRIIAASLQWRDDPATVAFQAFSWPENAEHISKLSLEGLRLFIGHSGWSAGQLEKELEQKAWFVVPPSRDLIEMQDSKRAWRDLHNQVAPALRLLAEAPDDPSLN